jgi:DNA-binding Lrp family transcriptional regulator/ribosome-associated protein YbcJ (S4-like RNA binding protein)
MKTFKEYILSESLSTQDKLDALENTISRSGTYYQALWDWFMDNMDDSGIYANDAIPEDYFGIMNKKQVDACYKAMSKKFKDLLDLTESKITEVEDILSESLNTEDKLDALENAIGMSDKYDQALWDWFMDNMGDSGIYAGDAVPEDYLEVMDKKQTNACFKAMGKKFRDLLDLNESKINEVEDKKGAKISKGDIVLWKGDDMFKGKVIKIKGDTLTVDATANGKPFGKIEVLAFMVQTEDSFNKSAKANGLFR